MIARIRPTTGEQQSIHDHSHNVASIMRPALASLGLGALGHLTGLLHDAGKCTAAWQRYIEKAFANCGKEGPTIPHAFAGALYAYERWYEGDMSKKLTSQLISLVIRSHHSGFPDLYGITENGIGESPYYESLKNAREDPLTCLDEAMGFFFAEVMDAKALDVLFDEAQSEVERCLQRIIITCTKPDRVFDLGMVARLLLSALVDADRLDSARFEYADGGDPAEPEVPWHMLHKRLEKKIAEMDIASEISMIRANISEKCLDAAKLPKGIYRLTVPTGGGKTLSSLRFALCHAMLHKCGRLYYVIPFNTILDQTGKEIRKQLDQYERILEHHGNVVCDSENEYAAHTRLTQRWDGDIVLTSFVQFMNCLFRKENTDARRMHCLCNSVIIFDEVQAIPQNCIGLFERAIRFLTAFCGCTVLLCTATQPKLELECKEIVPDAEPLFRSLMRTVIYDETDIVRSADRASADAAALLEKYGSMLMIVNTKSMAAELYTKTSAMIPADVHCFHLTTGMYPAHRWEKFKTMIELMEAGQRVLCISTALIEAGVNISFPCIVRSFAGLPSILQAGGRCNRHGELPNGKQGAVYVWRLDENLANLQYIVNGQKLSKEIFEYARNNEMDLQQTVCIEKYFALEQRAYGQQRLYPIRGSGTSLVEALGANPVGKRACELNSDYHGQLVLTQAFRSAGSEFHVIDEETVSVVIPHGNGKALLDELNGRHTLRERLITLQKLQQYSVGLFLNVFQRMLGSGIIRADAENGIYILREEYYNDEIGVTEEPKQMTFMNV